ncbi:MAG: hypothetical protein HYY01_04885 [Chloroflexi bacterium]|nr:hypothetical protein [Chloroflexota bacterium]
MVVLRSSLYLGLLGGLVPTRRELTLTISRYLAVPEQRTYPWVWLLALSGGVLSHILEDYGLGWF